MSSVAKADMESISMRQLGEYWPGEGESIRPDDVVYGPRRVFSAASAPQDDEGLIVRGDDYWAWPMMAVKPEWGADEYPIVKAPDQTGARTGNHLKIRLPNVYTAGDENTRKRLGLTTAPEPAADRRAFRAEQGLDSPTGITSEDSETIGRAMNRASRE